MGFAKKLISIMLAVSMVIIPIGTITSYGEEPSSEIVILHTNDMHSRIDAKLGYESLKGWKDYYKSKGSQVIVLDAGDAIHGMPVANLSKGQSIVDLMNNVGYTAMTPGNHDFNYGTSRLIELSKSMSFDMLSVNLKDSLGKAVFNSSKIYEAGDKKIGIIGISTPDTATKTNPLNVAGYNFSEKQMVNLVQSEIDSLNKAGADYIVALGHLGTDLESAPYRSTDIVSKTTGLDVFIDGHSHSSLEKGQLIKDKNDNEVLLCQTGALGGEIGKVIIDNNGKVTASLIKEPKENLEIKGLISKELTNIEPLLNKIVGKTSVYLDGNRDPGVRTLETNLGDFAADAIKIISGAEVSLTNGGGIRTSIEKGEITYGEINSVFPFGNTVVVINVSGSAIKEALINGTKSSPYASGSFPQVSGISYDLYAYKDAERVQNIKINGKDLSLNKMYKLATNDFTRAGGDGYQMFKNAEKLGEYGALDEALIKYINENLNGEIGSTYEKAKNQVRIILSPYNDTKAKREEANIGNLYKRGILKGTKESIFEPDVKMTNAMLVTALGRIYKVDASKYLDAKNSYEASEIWYSGYLNWALENEILKNNDNENMLPNKTFGKQELDVALKNYCLIINKDSSFVDEIIKNSISEDADYITRADAAEVLDKFIRAIENQLN